MRFKNLLAVLFLTTIAFSSATMAEGNGRMTVSGSIIKTQTSCSLATESLDQTIALGQVADAALLENNGSGKSTVQRFNIQYSIFNIQYSIFNWKIVKFLAVIV
ncbi:hypothetical protein NJH77_07235 [Serratia fonticola]|uniref:fimbrial protein n=1 Tax=Serratia fonticola TaxID=47917 RepID=UPI0020978491|nr:hypothetical protein [Serratia fonticola]MCO7509046.1 hypothetical protein [Serratia fonticola]